MLIDLMLHFGNHLCCYGNGVIFAASNRTIAFERSPAGSSKQTSLGVTWVQPFMIRTASTCGASRMPRAAFGQKRQKQPVHNK